MNEEFNDLGKLVLLKQLLILNKLHFKDKKRIIDSLESEWGKNCAQAILENKENFEGKDILARFYTIFR